MRGTLRLLAVAVTTGLLAACAQQPAMVTNPGRQAALEPARKTVARHRAPAVSEKQTAGTKDAAYGLASVTDVATGRSVTVRVNDRGPFVPGRVVDVSASAAETLGITGKGVAKVKLDVVEAK